MNTQPLHTIVDFLTSIGLTVVRKPVSDSTFLPGLQLENGTLVIDDEKLLYPGDVLHEAGHLATMQANLRSSMNDKLPADDLNKGGEMMALAWSYAACFYLKLAPEVVFHADGYKGESSHILKNFAEGRYIGLPLLQWAGMTYDKKRAEEINMPAYPHMTCWLRQT